MLSNSISEDSRPSGVKELPLQTIGISINFLLGPSSTSNVSFWSQNIHQYIQKTSIVCFLRRGSSISVDNRYDSRDGTSIARETKLRAERSDANRLNSSKTRNLSLVPSTRIGNRNRTNRSAATDSVGFFSKRRSTSSKTPNARCLIARNRADARLRGI